MGNPRTRKSALGEAAKMGQALGKVAQYSYWRKDWGYDSWGNRPDVFQDVNNSMRAGCLLSYAYRAAALTLAESGSKSRFDVRREIQPDPSFALLEAEIKAAARKVAPLRWAWSWIAWRMRRRGKPQYRIPSFNDSVWVQKETIEKVVALVEKSLNEQAEAAERHEEQARALAQAKKEAAWRRRSRELDKLIAAEIVLMRQERQMISLAEADAVIDAALNEVPKEVGDARDADRTDSLPLLWG